MSPPFETIPEKRQIDSGYLSSSEGPKSNTAPSELNLKEEKDLTGGNRKSLALDKRGAGSVLALASMFTSVMQKEEDPAQSLRNRSTTVSTSQTDINSSKIPSKIIFQFELLHL